MPIGMLAAVAINPLIDGLLVGIGVTVDAKQGRVLTIALTLAVLFLSLSLYTSIKDTGAGQIRSAVISSSLSLSIAVGAISGAAILDGASRDVLAAVLAFGAAALLYLVTEELHTEAHEAPNTPLLTAMFFIGFILCSCSKARADRRSGAGAALFAALGPIRLAERVEQPHGPPGQPAPGTRRSAR